MTLDEAMELWVFARVVQTGSFTAAARELGVSKSVVSGRVSGLEARLGVRLLHRTTRRLSLTTDGLEIYERCARMDAAAAEALSMAAAAGGEPHGTLRVTAPILFGQMYLGAPSAAFTRAYSAVRLEFVLSDSTLDVVGERLDVAIRVSTGLPGSDLHARQLGRDRKVLCASPAYLKQHGTPESPIELSRHRCLHFSPIDLRVQWAIPTPQGPIIPTVNWVLVANDVALVREAAREGMGVAVMPGYAVTGDLAEGRLVEVLPAYPLGGLGVYAMHTPGRRTPAKVRAFIEVLARSFRSQPWAGSKVRRA